MKKLINRVRLMLVLGAIITAVVIYQQQPAWLTSITNKWAEITGSAQSLEQPYGLPESDDVQAEVSTALAVLTGLERQERCPRGQDKRSCDLPKYDREGQFGEAWADVDQDGCRTRDQVLNRDLSNVTTKDGCIVTSGTLNDGYSGKLINFKRGKDTSTEVQIDHIVPLSLAVDLGAADWPRGKRVAFANDVNLNLLAVDGTTNSAKSDKGLSEWMPETDFACTYTMKFLHVLDSYDLAITPQDAATAQEQLTSCTKVYGKPFELKPVSQSLWKAAARL